MAHLRQGKPPAKAVGAVRRRRSAPLAIPILIVALLVSGVGAAEASAGLLTKGDAGQKAKPAMVGTKPVKPRPQANSSIAGGYYPRADSWPWVTAIAKSDRVFTGSPLDRQGCTATLISPTRVLTAAHCVDVPSSEGATPQPASNFMVHVGRRNLSTNQGYTAYVTGVALHPKAYLPRQRGDLHQHHAFYDVAVLFLDRSIPVTPAPIGTKDDWSEWGYAYTMGWGHWNYDHNNPLYDGILRAAEYQLPPDSFCEYYFNQGTPTGTQHWYPNIHVCATHQAGRADCITHGDSGGPLMVTNSAGAWVLIGVTSFYPRNDSGVGCTYGGPFGWAWVAGNEIRGWPLSVAHPPVTSGGGGGGGGGAQVNLNMSAGQARSYIKRMIKSETNGRTTRLKTRCSRNDHRSFTCLPRWRIRRSTYKARGMVWHFQDGNEAFYTWEFKGKRYRAGRAKKFNWS